MGSFLHRRPQQGPCSPAWLPGPDGSGEKRAMSTSTLAWPAGVSLGGGRPAPPSWPGGAGTSSALWDAGAVPALTARCPHSCAPSRDASRAPTSCLSRLLEAAHILWPVALSQRCRDATLACHTLLPATLSRGPCADPGSLGPSRVISYLLNLTPAQSLLPLRSPACTGGSDVLALGHRLGSPGRCPRGSGAAAVCPSGPVLCVAPACCTDRPQVAPGLGTEETHPPPPSRPAVCTALGPRL